MHTYKLSAVAFHIRKKKTILKIKQNKTTKNENKFNFKFKNSKIKINVHIMRINVVLSAHKFDQMRYMYV